MKYPWGEVRRFHLFDAPWADGEDRLFGQEAVQNAFYRTLRSFVQDGRPNKLILLHGPNGSAKSTFIRCVGRALEHYSTLDEGALYRFSWMFPAHKSTRGGLGFGSIEASIASTDSFAYLPDDAVDARLPDELRDHPLLLVPLDERAKLLERVAGKSTLQLSDYLRGGSLSPKNRAIFDALLAGYHGDYVQVLRHVRVERFEISHRYRTGWVTVEPQLSVDASERQVTADRTLGALPPSLQSVALFEYAGEVVGANRGMIEYDDLLKRPLEHYKYLLTTVERAALSMTSATLFLDLAFVGSCNDIHLSAFREIPDFQSFKGRIELVRVPFILDVRHEEALYRERLREAAGTRHVAPHTAYVAALWAVLTRMRKPQIERFPSTLAEAIGKLSPIDKVDLYATGAVPEDLTPDRARELGVAHQGSVARVGHVSDLQRARRRIAARDARRVARGRRLAALRVRLAARRDRGDRGSVQADEPVRVPAPGRAAGRLSRSQEAGRGRAHAAVRPRGRRGARGGRARRGERVHARVRALRQPRHARDPQGEDPQRADRPHGGSGRGADEGRREDARDHRQARRFPRSR